MRPLERSFIRYLAYPIILGGTAICQLAIASLPVPYWPWGPATAAMGIAAVALLERRQPYEPRWLEGRDDTAVDLLHAFTSLSLIFFSIEIVNAMRLVLPAFDFWPVDLPVWQQVLLAGLMIDLGLWTMHWLSHKNRLLWRFHALHHSSERLYWLNGERRHPLSALLLAAPGILVCIFIGAPAEAIGSWFAIVAVHLAFQHANLDYTVGPLRFLLGVAENHRWHHKREYEDAQINFGEFWMIWDVLFGTYRFPKYNLKDGDVGMLESMPKTYSQQIMWPFKRSGKPGP